MNLLIIGAGGHGKVVKEIAESIGVFKKIDFIDDNNQEAVGKISELEGLKNIYDAAFVGIGNNHLRTKLIQKLENIGFAIPALIHPTAYISPSCVIEKGTVVEPKAIVNANTYVGKGCIISVGAIVDHDVIIENSVHINAGAIVKAGGRVEKEKKLEAGEIIFGYKEAVVQSSDRILKS